MIACHLSSHPPQDKDGNNIADDKFKDIFHQGKNELKPWGLNKMAIILQMTNGLQWIFLN